MRALLLPVFLAGCSITAPTLAQEIDPDSYAAADIAAIRKEADDLDIDQLAERMDAMRDGNWNGAAPTPPAGSLVSLELVMSSSFYRVEISEIAWRDAQGQWEWRRAKLDNGVHTTTSGVALPVVALDLDRQLASPERRAEIWYSPPSTPLKTGEEDACHDGASYLLAIHRAGQPDEFVVQSCKTRWLNGALINLIGSLGRS